MGRTGCRGQLRGGRSHAEKITNSGETEMEKAKIPNPKKIPNSKSPSGQHSSAWGSSKPTGAPMRGMSDVELHGRSRARRNPWELGIWDFFGSWELGFGAFPIGV